MSNKLLFRTTDCVCRSLEAVSIIIPQHLPIPAVDEKRMRSALLAIRDSIQPLFKRDSTAVNQEYPKGVLKTFLILGHSQSPADLP